jgi:multiple sugar transport system substrate-binding protein
MRMNIKRIASVSAISLLVVTGLTVTSPLTAQGAVKKVTALTLYHDKQGWDARFKLISTAIKPDGYSLTPTTFGDTTSFQNVLQQAVQTGKGPDMFTWWSGYRMVDGATNGLFADISDVWKDAIKSGDVSADLASQFTVKGKQYAIPNGVSFWPMFYSKTIFAKYGLTAPKTWADFINICDTLKKNGITPLAASVDGAWPAFIWFEQLMISTDPQLYIDLMNNKVKFTDPKVVAVLNTWKGMIDKGYFTAGDTKFFGADAASLVKGGTMLPVGTWNNGAFTSNGMVGGVDYDAFIIPNINPALKTQSIIVESGAIGAFAKGKNLASAKKALRAWLKVPAQTAWAKVAADGVPNPKVPLSDPVLKGLSSTVATNKVKLVQRFWEAGPVPLIEGGVADLGAFMLGTKTAQETAQALADRATTEWAAWKVKYGN